MSVLNKVFKLESMKTRRQVAHITAIVVAWMLQVPLQAKLHQIASFKEQSFVEVFQRIKQHQKRFDNFKVLFHNVRNSHLGYVPYIGDGHDIRRARS